MTTDNLLVLGILAVALTLFILEKPRVDVVALLVLVATVVTGLVTTEEAFAGFASPAVITVWAVFIVSGALTKTGVADIIAKYMLRFAGNNPTKLLVMMMFTAGIMSAFMNNIGAVAILLPAVMSISRDLEVPPSKLLMPLAVAALLGGNITLIGTPPNLIASSILENYGDMTPFGFFDFAPTGVAVLIVGIIYMLVFGRYLLPEHTTTAELSEQYPIREYLREVRVSAESPLVDANINRIRFGTENDVAIVYARRGKEFLQQASDRRLAVDDVLLLEGPPDDIRTLSRELKLTLRPDLKQDTIDEELEGAGQLIEISLSPRSKFRGKTLRELGFRSRYGVTILAIRHEGESLVSNVVDIPLRFGDVMLAQGSERRIERLRTNPNFMLLDPTPSEKLNLERAPLAVGVLAFTLLIITLGWLDTSTAMLMGALAMVVGGAINMEEAYQSIDWKSVFLIAGMLPLGVAMESTGTAEMLATRMINLVGNYGTVAVLMGVFILAAGLTSVISNAAAAVLVVPIAIDTALGLGVNPQPFVMTAVIAASTAFIFPIGHQANIIIFGPGGYRFFDFVRVGFLLNIIIMVVVTLLVPLVWAF